MTDPRIFSAAAFGKKQEPEDAEKADSAAGSQEIHEVSFIERPEDLSKLVIAQGVCLLPETDGKTIVYQPETGACLLVNDAAAELIRRIEQGKNIVLDEKAIAVLNYLAIYGIAHEAHGAEIAAESPQAAQACPAPSDIVYEPDGVALCLTSDCNLRCIYCYASGGQAREYMDFKLAAKAIDFVIKNALKHKKKNFHVQFHGGGEPTLAFDLMKRVVAYARRKGETHGLGCSFSLGTNLCFNEETRDFILENIFGATFSLDGPRDVHDLQRPRADGSGSFDLAVKNLKFLDEKGFNYGIRSTITGKNLYRMSEMIEYFVAEFPHAKVFHFEPITLVSRAIDSNLDAVDLAEFTKEFLKANDVAKRHGKEIITCCSDIFVLGTSFCGALGSGFWLTHQGNISTCAEVMYPENPLAKYFMIGRYDPKKDEFVVDKEKLAILRQRSIDNIAGCSTCFARFHCKGNCPARSLREGAELMDMTDFHACPFIREVIQSRIRDILEKKECRLKEEDYLDLADPSQIDASDIKIETKDF